MSEQIDIEGLKTGNEHAFRELVNVYGKELFNLCLNIVTNTEDAEDLAQESFIQAYHSIKSFREGSQLKTWLYRIAINKCYDHLRWKKRKKRFGNLIPLTNREDEPIEIPSNFQHPGIVTDNKETAKLLYAAVESLPDNQQTAFVLYEMQGMDYKTIAETMETSIPAVESLLFRARSALRKKLEKYYSK